MNQRRYLIKGTLLLTVMGLLTRMAGFFYKIFLSRTIGASEIGLYQMSIPVFSFCTALCGGGIQSAISRFTAEYRAKNDRRGAVRALAAGLFLSLSSSVLCTALLYCGADLVAKRFLLEESCARLLKVMALSLPFSMVHSCICGYFMGEKQVLPPALTQFIEQMIRIFFVVSVYSLSVKNQGQPGAWLMVLGQLAGEASSALFCAGCLCCMEGRHLFRKLLSRCTRWSAGRSRLTWLKSSFREILSVSLPLGTNRMLMCVLQAIEAALLPQMLQRAGMTSVEALSDYGTLTGMALPMVLFPTAVTSALGMLLLPAISEAHALHRQKQLAETVNATFLGGLLLGSFCLGLFLLFGDDIGAALFHSRRAGVYIRQLALVCPLLYINTAMMSILHGLGKSTLILLWNLTGFSLRLLCIVRLIPSHGMTGYLCGILLDDLLLCICILFTLYRLSCLTTSVPDALAKMFLPAIAAGGATLLFRATLGERLPAPAGFIAGGAIYCLTFLAIVWPIIKHTDFFQKNAASLPGGV
ncbi:MAG: oligosaccharide flippase family protein [Lachnospiraceae bacterium]|nr:oligosaccharide flippase family protein [Lachnospiraceae bacterium]